MPTAYKNGQIQGTSSTGTYANLYSASASTTAVISSLVVTNTGSTAALYRVGIAPVSAGSPTLANGQFLVYDATVQGNDTIALTLGITLSNSQRLYVSSSSNNVCFNAFVSEIS